MLSVLTPGNCSGSPGPSDSEWSMTKLFSHTRNRAAMEGGALPATAKPFAALMTSAGSLDASLISFPHSWNASNNSLYSLMARSSSGPLPCVGVSCLNNVTRDFRHGNGPNQGTEEKNLRISFAIVWHSRTAQTKILPNPTPKDAYNLLEVTVLGSVYIQKEVRKILTMTKLLS